MEAADIYFDNMRVPKENLIGKKGEGFKILLHWISSEKVEQCAVNVGIAQAALDEAVKYCKERMLRDRPMAQLQGIQWMLGEMQAKTQAARWLTYRAAFLQENHAPNWQTEVAAAKIFVVPVTMEVVEMSRRLHGAYGYSKEFKIE